MGLRSIKRNQLMKKRNSFLSNPWVIGIGSSLLAVLIIDFVTGTTILPTICNWIGIIITGIFKFLNHEFKWRLYWLILLFLSGPAITVFILWIIMKIQEGKEELLPDWLKYKKDNFDGIIYKWDYEKDYEGKYVIKRIFAYCPKCECQLVNEICPNCKSSYRHQLKPNYMVEPLIIHRINKKEYTIHETS